MRVFLCATMLLALAACTGGNDTRPVTHRSGSANLAVLKGLTSTEVKAMLGQPSFMRRDKPAEIWQYRNNVCILDLFLYPEEAGPSVAHYAVRSTHQASEDSCFDSFQVAQEK